jgi:isochorismate synthase/2-succinyl-5-enolpyruvyl-6-hydroxy-3-cyclohexene-1-carboxylate synthase/2-succinyl-6-hydroxy-2,4-cyclohexadiene-1-carboxylate synthase/O-succinylbenzoate synthase
MVYVTPKVLRLILLGGRSKHKICVQIYMHSFHAHSAVSGNSICHQLFQVAPLEGLHQESLEEAEDQLRYLITRLSGIPLPENLPLLNGSFSDWFHTKLGVQPNTLHPSVRCGVEMAVLAALAESLSLSLSNLLMGRSLQKSKNKETTERAKGGVKICALIESDGTPEEVADIAAAYVKQGFCTLKLKVARRSSPKEDAKVVAAVRDQVGPHVHIRADANRKWTYLQAIEFAKSVQSFDLEYVEEPLARPQDIPRFCDETGIRVALDETVDEDTIDDRDHLQECSSSGVVAMVIKPGQIGGFERAAAIAEWALNHGRTPVISAAFESSISLSAYAQFATYIDSWCQQTNNSRTLGSHQDGQHVPVLAHGLGTYTWLDGDVVKSENRFRVIDDRDGSITSEMVDLAILQPELDEDYISSKDKQMRMKNFSVSVENGANIHRFHVWDTGRNSQVNKVLATILH